MIDTCGSMTLKFMIFFFNLLAFIAGLGILTIGVMLKTHTGSSALARVMQDNADSADAYGNVDPAAWLLIAVGLFIVVLAFLGCCGAMTESRAMLIIFCIIMSVLIIVQVVGLCLPFAARRQLEQANFVDYEDALMKNHSMLTKDGCEDLNDLQHVFKCCFNETIVSACNATGAVQDDHCFPGKMRWTDECKDITLWDLYVKLLPQFTTVGVFFLVLEVAALIFAATLVYLISKQRFPYQNYA